MPPKTILLIAISILASAAQIRGQALLAAYAFEFGKAWSAGIELPLYDILDLGKGRIPLDVNDGGTVLLWEIGNRLLRWRLGAAEILLDSFTEGQSAGLNENGTVAAVKEEGMTKNLLYWMPGQETPSVLDMSGHVIGDPLFLDLFGLNDRDQAVIRTDASDNLFFIPETMQLDTSRISLPGESWTLLARYQYFYDIDFSLTQGGQVYNVYGLNNYGDTVGLVFEGEDYAAPGEPSDQTYDRQYFSYNINHVLDFEPLAINDANTIAGRTLGPAFGLVVLDRFGQRAIGPVIGELQESGPLLSNPDDRLEEVVVESHYFKRMSERDLLGRQTGTPSPDFRYAQLADIVRDSAGWAGLGATCISRNGRIAGTGWRQDPVTGQLTRHGFLLVPPLLVPDWDRDGHIRDTDRMYSSQQLPWRFWINDDDDSGDLARSSMDDLPGSDEPDCLSPGVDGLRDGIDFFPVLLDLQHQLRGITEPGDIEIRLSQADGAVNVVWSRLHPENVRAHHEHDRHHDYGRQQDEPFASATTEPVPASGVAVPRTFLDDLQSEGRGVLLLEATGNTTEPLVVEVTRGGMTVLRSELPLSISPVRDMMRIINLRQADPLFVADPGPWASDLGEPPNLPDAELARMAEPLRTLVHIHGFNWTGEEIPAAHSELFKRFYQSGSMARFVGVSWHGDAGTLDLTNSSWEYNANVTNAFVTAHYLHTALQSFAGPFTSILAHSLGNMVASSLLCDFGFPAANYFMLNAAAPLESYDGETSDRRHMVHPDWKDAGTEMPDYPEHLLSTNWYRLFATDDHRSTLRWKDRFSSLTSLTNCLNFYSAGEDVLRTGTGDLPGLLTDVADKEWVWVFNEMVKGTDTFAAWLAGKVHGGWGFNRYYMDWINLGGGSHPPPGTWVEMPPEEAALQDPSGLVAEPFFRPFTADADAFPSWNDGAWLYGETATANSHLPPLPLSGAEPALIWNHARIMAEAIPAHSAPVGSQPLRSLPLLGNFDMDSIFRDPSFWPARDDVRQRDRWLHSDYLNPAYAYVGELYTLCVNYINTRS